MLAKDYKKHDAKLYRNRNIETKQLKFKQAHHGVRHDPIYIYIFFFPPQTPTKMSNSPNTHLCITKNQSCASTSYCVDRAFGSSRGDNVVINANRKCSVPSANGKGLFKWPEAAGSYICLAMKSWKCCYVGFVFNQHYLFSMVSFSSNQCTCVVLVLVVGLCFDSFDVVWIDTPWATLRSSFCQDRLGAKQNESLNMRISKSIRFGHRSTNPFGDSTKIDCLKMFGSIWSRRHHCHYPSACLPNPERDSC